MAKDKRTLMGRVGAEDGSARQSAGAVGCAIGRPPLGVALRTSRSKVRKDGRCRGIHSSLQPRTPPGRPLISPATLLIGPPRPLSSRGSLPCLPGCSTRGVTQVCRLRATCRPPTAPATLLISPVSRSKAHYRACQAAHPYGRRAELSSCRAGEAAHALRGRLVSLPRPLISREAAQRACPAAHPGRR